MPTDYINSLRTSCLYNLDTDSFQTVIDHPDFKYFCELISELKESRSDKARMTNTLHGMKHVMRRMFGVSFELTVIDNEMDTDMRVCNVFPPYQVCRQIADLIIEENSNEIAAIRDIWEHTALWHVDIDSRILFDTSCEFNPAEIALLIIYNVERIVYSYDIVTRANYIINKNFLERGYTMNKLARSHVCRNLFILPFFSACEFKTYPYEDTELVDGTCIKGDLYKIYTGAIRKLITYSGNEDIDVPIGRLDAAIQSTCDWIFACITDLKYSTRMLKETLRKVVLSTKSYYVKNIIIDILTTFGDYSKADVVSKESADFGISRAHKLELNPHALATRQRQLEHAVQQRIKKAVAVSESFFDLLDSIGNMKKVTQRDVDILNIEAQKIQNTDDKLYVLDSIHDKLDIVETSLTLLQNKDTAKKVKVSKSSLIEMKKALDELRESVIDRQLKSSHYSLFVKYPEGYEG